MRLLLTLGFIGLGIYAIRKHQDAVREAKQREAWQETQRAWAAQQAAYEEPLL